MKSKITLFTSLLLGFVSYSQNIEIKDFIKTEWFSNISNYDFIKTDSLTLIHFSNYSSDDKLLSDCHIKSYYFYDDKKEFEITTLYFGKINSLGINRITNILCGISGRLENLKWEFDAEKQIFTFAINEKEKFKYKIIEKKIEKAKWTREIDKIKFVNFNADLIILILKKI